MSHKWTEGTLGSALARNTFANDLCVLPNCIWTGDEIDLLVVTPSRRVIDVEIKISRADLKVDRDKGKWWREVGDWVEVSGRYQRSKPAERREWPRAVWKHYYALPQEIWKPELLECMAANSGVLLISGIPESRHKTRVECVRRAKPCKNIEILSDEHVVKIARLASLRMWDAYRDLEQCRAERLDERK
jgi:hypothetical protein